ncbi:phosphatidate cytidylyltransferase [Hydrogenimonas sp.]
MSPAALTLTILVLAALVVASLAVRRSDSRELRLRVRSWWAMAALFFGLLALGRGGAVTLFALVSYLALKEYFTMIPIRRVDRRIIFWAYLAIPVQYGWAYMGWYEMFIIWVPVYLFLFLPFRQVLTGDTQGFVESTGKVQWGLMLFLFSLSHLGFMATLPPVKGASGLETVMFVVVLTELNDIYQYLWGQRLGRRKIVPRVSPNKTVEGFAGALVTTTATALALRFLTPFTPAEAALAGLIVGAAGFVGDVVVSMIKRDVGIKDSGTTIPGHGGVLDRIDSLTYTAPLMFHYIYYLYY